jgi:hypothetical protein
MVNQLIQDTNKLIRNTPKSLLWLAIVATIIMVALMICWYPHESTDIQKIGFCIVGGFGIIGNWYLVWFNITGKN